MSYSSDNFLKPIGSDKNIKLYDDNFYMIDMKQNKMEINILLINNKIKR
jgi:hypothetical protein